MTCYRVFAIRTAGAADLPGYVVDEDRPDVAQRIAAALRALDLRAHDVLAVPVGEAYPCHLRANAAACALACEGGQSVIPYRTGRRGLPGPGSRLDSAAPGSAVRDFVDA